MNRLMATFRAARVGAHIAYALGLACIFPWLSDLRQRTTMQRWSVALLKILNVEMHARGQFLPHHAVGQLIVANHISWLDVFVINANTPARFVAKAEVGAWPLLGWLVRRSGTLFIRREFRRDTARTTHVVTSCLHGGEPVAVFPQGTSTDGTQPVHFHSAMVQAAIDAGATVQPLSISYHDGEGRSLPQVAFTGEMTFMASLWQIVCLPRIHVNAIYLEELQCDDMNRRQIAKCAQAGVNAVLANSAVGVPWVSDNAVTTRLQEA
jgi:1-acyl-sn-glycerol-3-phosphate acyltransferase